MHSHLSAVEELELQAHWRSDGAGHGLDRASQGLSCSSPRCGAGRFQARTSSQEQAMSHSAWHVCSARLPPPDSCTVRCKRRPSCAGCQIRGFQIALLALMLMLAPAVAASTTSANPIKTRTDNSIQSLSSQTQTLEPSNSRSLAASQHRQRVPNAKTAQTASKTTSKQASQTHMHSGGTKGSRVLSAPYESALQAQEWAQDGPAQLAECVNDAAADAALKPLSWERALKNDLNSLLVHAVWWSQKPSPLPITIVTQLSASRLHQLSAQCRGWHGPLSAAIYVPLLKSSPTAEEDHLRAFRREMMQVAVTQAAQSEALLEPHLPQWQQPNTTQRYRALSDSNLNVLALAEKAVMNMHAATERQHNGCALDLVLVYELLHDARAASLLYPVNQLRNMARLQARTELIAQLDVDMLISTDMAKWMANTENARTMIQNSRRQVVYVLPAFEAHGQNTSHSAALSDVLSMQSKRRLAGAMSKKVVTHFDAMRFPQGHNTTDFKRWFTATEPYPITYTYRFEPWLVVHRTLAPWHDVRFRGYGNNKIQQVSHLNATGHKFYVHPVGFIIHRAHALTAARKQLITDLHSHSMEARKPGGNVNRSTLYGHTKVLFESAKAAMDKGTFNPVLDPASKTCSSSLPWFKIVY